MMDNPCNVSTQADYKGCNGKAGGSTEGMGRKVTEVVARKLGVWAGTEVV